MTQQYDFFKEYGLNFDKSEREQLRPKNTIVLDNEEEIFESPIPEGCRKWLCARGVGA